MGEAWAWLGIVAAVIGAAVAGLRKISKAAKTEADLRDARGYITTRDATDEVDMGNDPGLVRDRMRERDPDKR